jgi:hypothetical protein
MKLALSHITAAAFAALTAAVWKDIQVLYEANSVITITGLACWSIVCIVLVWGLANAAYMEAYNRPNRTPEPQEVTDDMQHQLRQMNDD